MANQEYELRVSLRTFDVPPDFESKIGRPHETDVDDIQSVRNIVLRSTSLVELRRWKAAIATQTWDVAGVSAEAIITQVIERRPLTADEEAQTLDVKVNEDDLLKNLLKDQPVITLARLQALVQSHPRTTYLAHTFGPKNGRATSSYLQRLGYTVVRNPTDARGMWHIKRLQPCNPRIDRIDGVTGHWHEQVVRARTTFFGRADLPEEERVRLVRDCLAAAEERQPLFVPKEQA